MSRLTINGNIKYFCHVHEFWQININKEIIYIQGSKGIRPIKWYTSTMIINKIILFVDYN